MVRCDDRPEACPELPAMFGVSHDDRLERRPAGEEVFRHSGHGLDWFVCSVAVLPPVPQKGLRV